MRGMGEGERVIYWVDDFGLGKFMNGFFIRKLFYKVDFFF